MMGLMLWGCAAQMDRISPADLSAGLKADPAAFHIVDVRTGFEYRGSGGHIPGAISRPYPGILFSAGTLEPRDGQTVVLVCLSGHRSRFPMKTLRENHPSVTVVDLEGGMQAWWALDLPTERGSE